MNNDQTFGLIQSMLSSALMQNDEASARFHLGALVMFVAQIVPEDERGIFLRNFYDFDSIRVAQVEDVAAAVTREYWSRTA